MSALTTIIDRAKQAALYTNYTYVNASHLVLTSFNNCKTVKDFFATHGLLSTKEELDCFLDLVSPSSYTSDFDVHFDNKNKFTKFCTSVLRDCTELQSRYSEDGLYILIILKILENYRAAQNLYPLYSMSTTYDNGGFRSFVDCIRNNGPLNPDLLFYFYIEYKSKDLSYKLLDKLIAILRLVVEGFTSSNKEDTKTDELDNSYLKDDCNSSKEKDHKCSGDCKTHQRKNILCCVDLTNMAVDKKLDPVFAREFLIDQVLEVLCRRKKSNPILIGEPGVGKTAIVEGLAQRLLDLPESHCLYGKHIVSLDIAGLIAGTNYRGDFEKKLQQIIEEILSIGNVILYIDEIHTIVGAGSTVDSSLDVSNILKPYLASGQISCIGSTTTNEYNRYIQSDGALSRRFQKIIVPPTSILETREILQNLLPLYEDYHKVQFYSCVVDDIIAITDIYVRDRVQPDKSIDLLDVIGAKFTVGSKARLIVDQNLSQSNSTSLNVFYINRSIALDVISKYLRVDKSILYNVVSSFTPCAS